MKNYTSSIPLSALCTLFSKCSSTTKHALKKKLLQKFFQAYQGDDYYHIMRLMLPQLDRDRQTYGLKETMLAKCYVQILGISDTSEDAVRLLNWRKPTRTKSGSVEGGDFGNAVYQSLRNRCPSEGECSVNDLNVALDALNTAATRDQRIDILKGLLRITTAEQQKWIVRIVIKELKIGLSEKSVLNYFHQDAVDYYNITSSLKKVCQVLKDPDVRLSSMNLALFNPVKPMLASRHLPEQVVKLMDGNDFIIETKYDGERIQVHKDTSFFI